MTAFSAARACSVLPLAMAKSAFAIDILTNNTIYDTQIDWHTHKQMDRQTTHIHIRIHTAHTHMHSLTHTDRQTDRQTDRHTHIHTKHSNHN